MSNEFKSYESIRIWKDEQISNYKSETHLLNEFHDLVMRKVLYLALNIINKGEPPCKFSWFVTGSGGRFEQGLISDQDHGLVFAEGDSKSIDFFQQLGEEISYGLNAAGYPYCEGKVMSSNSLWCKSLQEWKNQLFTWMEEGSWESIRYLHIFYDARVLAGENDYVKELKIFIHDYQRNNLKLLKRLMDNVMNVKNAIGPLGQIITEENGMHRGAVDLKYTAFLPYVNAVRLLAMKEGLQETPTIDRLNVLLGKEMYKQELEKYKISFLSLIEYRKALNAQVESYEKSYFLNVKKLTKEEKKDIKQILKNGKKLHQYVMGLIEKGVE